MFNLFKDLHTLLNQGGKEKQETKQSFAEEMWSLAARYKPPSYQMAEDIRDQIRFQARNGLFTLSSGLLHAATDLSDNEKKTIVEDLQRQGLKIKIENDFHLSISWE